MIHTTPLKTFRWNWRSHNPGCSKRPDFSPAQPRRAKSRRSAGKAAAPGLTLVLRFTPHVSRSLGATRARCWWTFQHPVRRQQFGLPFERRSKVARVASNNADFAVKKHGMSDGFRISSDHEDNQDDQALTNADRGNTEQHLRESATSRNQGSDKYRIWWTW